MEKKLNILFVYPNFGTPYSFHPGVQILSSIARKHGHNTALLHLHEVHGLPIDKDVIVAEARQHSPDVIAFTSTDFEYKTVEDVAQNMKKEFPSAFFVLGGMGTILGKEIEKSAFDAFAVGEVEIQFAQLLDAVSKGQDYTGVKSFWFKKDGRIIKNEIGEMVQNLDDIPMMDWEIMDTVKLLEMRNRWLSLQFSRGCPYNCSYCIVTAIKKQMFEGRMDEYLRKRSAESAIQEMEYLAENFGKHIEVFNLDDDLLMVYRNWMLEFCKKYKERIYDKHGIMYAINGRVNVMDEQLIKAMAESGCKEIRIGFETGNFKLRKDILHKPIPDDMIVKVFKMCTRYGIHATAFTMIGIPEETHETIKDTLRMVSEMKPFLVRLSFCYPFEHTPLYDYSRDHKLFKPGYMEQPGYFTESPLMFKDISDDELLKYKMLFPWHLNVIMLPEYAARFKVMIDRFDNMNYDELRSPDTLKLVVEMDTAISKELETKCIPHYGYFNKNIYYFHLKLWDASKEQLLKEESVQLKAELK